MDDCLYPNICLPPTLPPHSTPLTNTLSRTKSSPTLKLMYKLQFNVVENIDFFLVHINFKYLKWSQTVLIHQYQLCLPALSRVSKYAPHLTFTQLFWLFIFSYKSWLLCCQCFLKLYYSRKGTKVETPISSTSPDVFCTGLGIYYMDILHYEQHASWKQQELHCLCFAEALLSETLLFLQVRVFQHKHAY